MKSFKVEFANNEVVYLDDYLYSPLFKTKWHHLKDCAEYKGVSYKTITNQKWLQPLNGNAEKIICGRKCWSSETVLDWIEQDDEELLELYKESNKRKGNDPADNPVVSKKLLTASNS